MAALFLALLSSSLAPGALGAETLVNTPDALTAAISVAQRGDTIVMQDGVWTDADILFTGLGTATQPITLRAQTLGGVQLTGQSRLRISGNFLVVDGLTFTNGYRTSGDVIAFQNTSSSVANNCRLTDCAIVDYNPPNPTNDTKWVSLYGFSNRVDNCYFKGKVNVGTTLVVWVSDLPDAPNYHLITRNYFGPRPALVAASNGGETIRVGTSDVSFNLSRTTVEENFFQQCNGDVEIISSKSCENIYRHNTFLECEGALSLRHGNRNIVEGNYFFGNHKTNTGGVRIVGDDHKVYNNYFQDLAGTSSRAPLAIMQGLVDSPLNGYFQVHRALVAFNTFVNCTNSMLIGLAGTLSGTTETTTLPPVDCTNANNIVFQPAGKIVDQRIVPENLFWEGNIFYGATLNIPLPTNGGIAQINPQLVLAADSLWRPDTNSPALNAAQGTNYNFVTQDFEGQARPALKDAGCDQASLAPRLYSPLAATNAGPLWMRIRGTFLTWPQPVTIVYGTPLGSVQLNASANAAGTLAYDPPAGTILPAGSNQTLTVTFTPTDLANFSAATQSVTINVLKATPVLAWANPAPITYGTPLSGGQLNASADVPGTYTYYPQPGAVLNASNAQTLNVSFVPDDTSNFSPVIRSVSVKVLKAQPVITWSTPASIEQGTALGSAQLNAVANVPGNLIYAPTNGTVLAGGIGQPLSVSFTPNDTANYSNATRTVTINVTIGGKTVPAITWPMPAPILTGTPLDASQLNASASTAGTFVYSPANGTVLPAGNGQILSVTFTPTDTVTYTSTIKTVTINVAPLSSNALVRVAYMIPANRVPQGHAVSTLRNIVLQYQKFFADQMERNGFGRKTFTFESEPDGVTPSIHVLNVPATDSFLRGDIYGNRVLDAARNAGLTIGAPGQVWWLIPETHRAQADGSISGGFDVGYSTNAAFVDSGWAIDGSDHLALYQTIYQTNGLPYDGFIVPEIGPYPLVQDVSFPWFEGLMMSGISSSVVGSSLRNIGEAFGLDHDFRNDENFNGNLMGFGFRGIRGEFYPDKYLYNYCGLSYASALALSVSPFFNPGQLATDLNVPNVAITTSGTRTPVNGLLEIAFNASDDQALHAALLTWESDSDFILAGEMLLSGTNASGVFAIPYFNSQQTNRYRVTVFDRQGNRRSAQTSIYPAATLNRSPQPFIRVSPVVAGLGEDVMLDASDTFDPEHGSGLLEVEWDLDGDGVFDTEPSNDLVLTTNFFQLGSRLVRARITDPAGDVAISAPVALSITLCAASISPTNHTRNHGYGGGTATNKVTAGRTCHWTAFNTNDWISILSPPDMVGSDVLVYSVQPNPDFAPRSGTLLIADQVFTVTQDPAICTYSLSPTNRFHGYGTGNGTIKVTPKAGCSWAVINENSWITIISNSFASGTATVGYAITDNRVTGRRSGNIFIADKVFTVTQWGTNCELALTPGARFHSENSETGLVTVSTGSSLAGSCDWSIENTNSWITLTTTNIGVGSGSFGYLLEPNFGLTPRTGVMTAGGESFTVIQDACSYTVAPLIGSLRYGPQTSNVTVTAGAICAWTVVNTNSWISISVTNGIGSGTFSYHVDANPISESRSGTFNVAGFNYFVTQDPKPCNYEIDLTDDGQGITQDSQGESGGFGEVHVSADPGCYWTASSPVSWIQLLNPETGESTDAIISQGSASAFYIVQPNSGPARSATLTIADQDLTVSQASGIRQITATDLTLSSGETNSISVKLDAHGGENTLAFSLCFETNLLAYSSGVLRPGAPVGAALTINSNEAPQGHLGITVAMPPGYSMPAGTSTVIQVFFRAVAINGKASSSIAICDAPVARQLIDGIGQNLSANFVGSAVQVIGFCSLAEALDAPNTTWTVSAVPWACQTNVTHDLEDAASSGATPNGGESYFETTFIGPGTLSFWWKVSSEPSSDRLRLYMDGSSQFTISGEVDWEWRTFNVPSGSHVMRWRYDKNGSVSLGQDRGWVDQLVYVPAPPSITTQPASTNVDAGSVATFNVVASGQPPLTYQWFLNQSALNDGGDIRGTHTATLILSNVQSGQAGSYSVQISTPQGNLSSANAILNVMPVLPLPEALDAAQLVWTNAGNAPWIGQAAVSHDGFDAARSGNITHSQSTSFQTTLNGPGTVTFWWKVSSEPTNDKLLFSVNGTEQSRISGEVDWQQKTFAIASGTQVLLWTYSKNSSTSAGQDRAWVDEFRFTPTLVSITGQPTNQVIDQGATATLAVAVSGTPPISYQWLFNGTNLVGATNATLVRPNFQAAQTGAYAVLVSNAAGSVISSNATLFVNQLVPLSEAIDATNLVWTTSSSPSGSALWVGQSAISKDGSDAARSGRIADSQNTSFQTTVTGPGTVSFWWKVSSESSDKLAFYMGGSSQQSISGEVDWTWRSWTVSSGTQVLEWRYTKNSSASAGQDYAWVDQIHYVPNNTPTAPFMAIQPTNRTVVAPATVTLTAVAGGSATLGYQWLLNGSSLTNGNGVSGVTTTNLTLTSVSAAQAGDYSALVTNAAGSISSAVAHLTVVTAPVIITQPVSQNVLAGSTVSFNVGAIGLAPLSYQWMWNGIKLTNGTKTAGVTTSNLILTNVQVAQEGIYSVLVSNAAGIAISSAAGVLTTWDALRTGLTTNGETTTLGSTVTGPGTLKFSWKVSSETNSDLFRFYLSGVEQARISGEVDWHDETFTIPAGVQALDWRYSKDAVGSAGQDAGFLDAVEFTPSGLPMAPTIINPPINRTVGVGATMKFDAGVGGSIPAAYQWLFNNGILANGAGVSGVHTPHLILAGVQLAQAGTYSLFVSNAAGMITSSLASLVVTSAPVSTAGAPVITSPPISQNVSENAGVNFSVVAAGTAPFSYRWQCNGTNLLDGNGISGSATPSLSLSNVSPSQIGNYSVLVSNAFGSATSSAASLTVLTLAEAVGAPYLNLSQAGYTSWVAQTSITLDGLNAARSGLIPDGQNTRLETWVDGPGIITFWWKVSCESVNDNLRFYIGATEMARISGEVDWQQQSFTVPSGTQILLKWRYGKDASGSAGQDAGWVDEVQYTFTGASTAPAITNQPQSQIARVGDIVTFNAGASGSLPMVYQWRFNGTNLTNGSNLSGAKAPRLTLTGAQLSQVGNYSLLVSNAGGTVTSAMASLTVTTILSAPIISTHPLSQAVSEGVTAIFNVVTAGGTTPLSYQWQFNAMNLQDGPNVSGATTPLLRLDHVSTSQIGNYSVMVSNEAGVVSSANAALTLLSLSEVVGAPYFDFSVTGNTSWLIQTGQSYDVQNTNGGARLTVSILPTITQQPTNETIIVGNSASFMVGITSTPPNFIQWRFNGAPLLDGNGVVGANTTTLLLTDGQAADSGNYSVFISNAVGIATSSNALLTVLIPPSVAIQPVGQMAAQGGTVSMSVVAAGSAPFTYHWRRNGTNLVNGGSVSGANTATLILNNAQPSQGGFYSVEVSNAAGSVVSDDAQFTVQATLTTGDALNAPYLQWDTDLSAPWFVQTNITHDGEAAVQSGNITNSSSTWIETVVTGPGTIRFWWKVSSQTNADTLTFSVGGAEWASISGVVDWQKMSFSLPGGEFALRWSYAKDSSLAIGLDHGWLDEVDFIPTTGPSVPVIIRQPEGADVEPGTTVTLSMEALGTAPLSYQWRFEGQNLGDGGNVFGSSTPTLTLVNAQLAQNGAYDVVVRNPYSIAVSEQAFVNVIPIIPIPAALDTDYTNLVWLTGGYSPWRGQTNYNSDRIDSAQSGLLPNNQTNYIQTIVNGPGAISFWWKCSSETNHDRLRFTANGVELANISGETEWRSRTFAIDYPGTVLRWLYTKDASGSAGLDRGWVDQVTFGPSAPIITNAAPDVSVVDQGTTLKLAASASGTTPFSYQWDWNGTNLVNSDTNLPLYPGFITGAVGSHRLIISNAQPYQSGFYSCEVMNAGGIAISPQLSVQVIPALPLGPALNTNLIWNTSGYSWWVGTTNVTHDGIMAARNGTLPASEATKMSTTVVGPGTLTFWWKASTETNADVLTFYINGNSQAAISGNKNWEKKTFDLLSGTFLLEWEYNKNGLLTNGLDQVFVDEVTFGPAPPVITNNPASQTVDQGSTVTFTAGVRGTPPVIYQWLFNGAPLANGGNVSGATTLSLKLTGALLSQAGTYSLRASNAADVVTSTVATLTLLPTFPLADALDVTGFTWTTGSPAWVGQGITSHDGVDAARSPAIGDSATASMQTTISGPGTISFWWKVSSQTNADYLIFYIGSTEQARISGEVGWQQKTFTLPAGSQTVKWTYSKNGSTASGQDRGWVDQFVFTPVMPSITTQPANTNVDEGGTATFSVVAGGTPPFTYQWQYEGQDLTEGEGVTGANAATLTVPDIQLYYAGNWSVVVGNAAGFAVSSNAALTVTHIVPLAEALDGSNLVWSTSGAPAWVGQTAVMHDGVDAARITGVANSASASIQATVTGPGTVTFWWKVSSEASNDKLTFYTNGTAAMNISGEVDWQFKSVNLGSGSQILKWTYSKNSSVVGGQDRAWVDQVFFGPVPPTITTQPTNQSIDAGASASFNVAVSGTPPFTYQWQRDGEDLLNGSGISGATSSNLVLTGAQTAQAGSYRVFVNGQAGSVFSASATLSVYSIVPLAEALDTPGVTWTTNGTPPWVGHGAVTHDGSDAARSGAIGNSATTSMSTVLNGPSQVSFWWKVSSQTNSDKLIFLTNGVAAMTISGEVDWEFKTLDIGAGTQTLTWTYSKNGSTTTGQDRGWVDQVAFGLVGPSIITQPASVTADAGSNATFTILAAATPPIYYQWLFNGSPITDGSGISGATTPTLAVANVQPSTVGSYSVVVSNAISAVTSTSALLNLSTNVTLAQALDGAGMTYIVGGTGQPWKGQQLVTHDGADAAQSGFCADSTYTYIKATVTGPGPLTFWWKISSEQDHDYLRFMVDAVDQVKISGELDWQQVTYNVPSGSHELQWRYSKNSSLAAGQDRCWLDEVFFGTNTAPIIVITPPPVSPSILIQPVSQTVDEGDTISLSVSTAGSTPMVYRWLRDGTNITDGGSVGGATTRELTLYNVLASQAGNYSVAISNSAGMTNSATARLVVLPVIDLAEALDANDLFVLTSGDAPWIGHTVVTHDGTDAGRSGMVVDGQSSVMETTLNGPGTLSFWWKVSSETNGDTLTFSINDQPQDTVSGEVDWQWRTYELPAGPAFLEWAYVKNDAVAAGLDRSWVDQLSFVPGGGTITTSAPPAAVAIQLSSANNKVQLTWQADTEKTYKVFYKDNLSDPQWTVLDEEVLLTWRIVDGQVVPDAVIATVEDILAGQMRFYRVFQY